VLVGLGPHETGELPLAKIQTQEIWVTGTFRYANTDPTAIALAATGASIWRRSSPATTGSMRRRTR
jgi:L-iditol 2-dehydrogenase